MARNRIVAAEHQLQSGDVSTRQRLTIDDARRYRRFMRGHVAHRAPGGADLDLALRLIGLRELAEALALHPGDRAARYGARQRYTRAH